MYRAPRLQPAANQPPQQPQQGAAKGKRKQVVDSSAAAGGAADPDAALRAQLTAVLEEPPKWALLTDVLLVSACVVLEPCRAGLYSAAMRSHVMPCS